MHISQDAVLSWSRHDLKGSMWHVWDDEKAPARNEHPDQSCLSVARAELKRKEVGISTWGVYVELGGSGKDYYKEFRNQEGYLLLSLMSKEQRPGGCQGEHSCCQELRAGV